MHDVFAQASLLLTLAAAGQLVIEPATVRLGSVIRIAADGFGPGEALQLQIDGAPHHHLAATALGKLRLELEVPYNTRAGSHTVTVYGLSSLKRLSREIVFEGPSLSLSVDESQLDRRLAVQGERFLPGEGVVLLVGGRASAPISVSLQGSLQAVIDLPGRLPRGSHAVVARGNTSGRTVTATFSLGRGPEQVAVLSVVPSMERQGLALYVTASELFPGEEVSLSLDGHSVGSFVADENGELTTRIAPAFSLEVGPHSVALEGEAAGWVETLYWAERR